MSYPPPPGDGPTPPGMPPAPPPPPYQQPYGQPPAAGGGNNPLGLAAMIVGIVSIPLVCCAWLGLVVGAVGAVLGFIAQQQIKQNGQANLMHAKVGFICGLIGAGLSLVLIVLSFVANFSGFLSV